MTGRGTPTLVHTEEAGTTGTGETIFSATDTSGGVHLFVPIEDQEITPDSRSTGVTLIAQRMVLGQHEQTYADLVCHQKGLHEVFRTFSADVLRRLEGTDDPLRQIRSTLSEWRALLRTMNGSIPWSLLVGLRGELELLARLVNTTGPHALETWNGPLGATRDFQGSTTAIEVKTSTQQSGHEVGVHGLEQMTPPSGLEYAISHIRLTENAQRQSVNDLMELLVSHGVDSQGLEQRVRRIGWTPEQADWDTGFEVLETSTWIIEEDFPGIRRDRFVAQDLLGVSALSYTLDLAAGGPPIDATSEIELFRRLCQP